MTPTEPPKPSPAPGGLGVVAGRGIFWMFSSTVLAKLLAIVNQVVLGWYLTAEEYGIFALSLGFAAIFMTLANGGIQHILVRRGAEAFDDLVNAAFWFATAFNLAAALSILLLTPVAIGLYGERDLAPVLAVMALGVALAAPSIVFQARLQVSLRFRQLAQVTLASAVAWSITVCSLAYLGFGALTFAWGNVAMALAEGAMGWWLTREAVHRWRPTVRGWRSFWRDSAWLNLGNVFSALTQRGDYFVLGFFLSTSVLGVYTFAFLLAAQINVIVGQQTQKVVVPVLRRFVDDAPRLAQASERFMPMIVVMTALPSLALALVAAPLEQLIWRGKWEPAVVAIVVFAAMAPLRMMSTVPHALVAAQGRFALRALLIGFQAFMVMAGAALGGWLFPDHVAGLALVVGLAYVVANQLVVQYVMPQSKLALFRLLLRCLYVYGLAALAALGAWAATHLWWPLERPFLVLAAGLAVYGVLVTLLLRLFAVTQIEEARNVLPARLAELVDRMLVLRRRT